MAELNCRHSHKSTEKRQRILISTRYDEAMENVNRTLGEMSQALQKLSESSYRRQESPQVAVSDFSGVNVSNALGISDGYRGDSSFQAHAQQVTEAVTSAISDLGLYTTDESTISATHLIQDLQKHSIETRPDLRGIQTTPFKNKYPELEGKSLPPLEPVLKVLRLAQSEKQQFFVDMPVIEEDQFVEMCQRAYFAIDDYSIFTWAVVNTGLFYLFSGLEPHNYAIVGVTTDMIESNLQVLAENVDAAIRSIRLCFDPSVEACQALAILVRHDGRPPIITMELILEDVVLYESRPE